jgi:hypothetical protein
MKQTEYQIVTLLVLLGMGSVGLCAEPFAKGPYLGQTPPGPIALAFGISTTVGIIFGLYPACCAANMAQ